MPSEPLAILKTEGLTDSVRPQKERKAGFFQAITNLFPNLSGSERIRPGYSAYNSEDDGGGLDAPTGMQITKVAPIQSPSQDDVHVFFTTPGVKMNPWWIGASEQATDMLLSESFSPTFLSGDVTIPTAALFVVTNWASYSSVTTTDYFKNWVVKNVTKTQHVNIKNFAVSGGTATFTILENIGASGLNWLATDTYIFYRNFHNNLGFTPTYNTDFANPIEFNVENSVIRFSGGQSSALGNRGIIVYPRFQATFFTQATGYEYTYDGTYATEREIKAIPKSILQASKVSFASGLGKTLQPNNTYRVGIAPIYGITQEGPLCRYETASDFGSYVGLDWTENYLPAGKEGTLSLEFSVCLATLDKRITGFSVYLSQDPGDTRSTGRVRPYEFLYYLSITSAQSIRSDWSFVPGQGRYIASSVIGSDEFGAKGVSYEVSSGVIEIPLDVMFAYSIEEIYAGRRWLANYYIASEGKIDRQWLITNPIGGNPAFNNGVICPDIFSNEEGFYRIKIDPTVGTKINGLVTTGMEEMFILKDRGAIISRVTMIDDQPLLSQTVISKEAGLATPNAWTRDDMNTVYFAGYDDIYAYKGGSIVRLVERPDKMDWLDHYRNTLTNADKESVSTVYLPEMKMIYFLFNNGTLVGKQFAFFPGIGQWRDVKFKESSNVASLTFKYFTKLQNGHVLGVSNEDTPTLYRMTWKYALGYGRFIFTYSDADYPIAWQIDTGDFLVDTAKNFLFDEAQVVRTLDSPTQGTLDCDVYLDGTLVRTKSSLDKTANYLRVPLFSDDRRLGTTLRLNLNSDTNDPERLWSGEQFQIDAIHIFARVVPRTVRASEAAQSATSGGIMESNTVQGRREVTLNKEAQIFTWDKAFTKSYTDEDGNSVPLYRITWEPPVAVNGDPNTVEEVILDEKTLTTFTAHASADGVRVKFQALEV